MNESQAISDIRNSVGIISEETLVAQHPWVTDVQEELTRIKKEKSEQQIQEQTDYEIYNETRNQ